MAATLPGLLDMMPSPTVFESARAAYTQGPWPDGIVPAQRWLTQSLNLKSRLIGSPLLHRATILMNTQIGTLVSAELVGGQLVTGAATGAGDGTVPALSAFVSGIPAFRMGGQHALMLLEADATRAVSELIQRGVCSLPAVGAADLTQAAVAHEAPAAIESIEAAAPIRERMRNGRLPQGDILWLLST